MNNQKVKVHYKDKINLVDFDLIENLGHLRVAISLAFQDLPPYYDIMLEDLSGNPLTNQEIRLLKQYGSNATKLFIRQIKDDELDVESISSELSKIQILEQSIARQKQQLKVEYAFKNSSMAQEKLSFEQERRFEDEIKQLSSSKNEEKKLDILNEDVQCNGCFAFPITGIIYKCLVCKDYDICSKCEESMHHFHPLLKITKKEHYPIKLKVVFSKKSKVQMEKLAEIDKLNEQRLKKVKYQKEVKDYKVIDPSTLKSKKICQKNFLSEIVGSID